MAELIVDGLESIEIQAMHGHHPRARIECHLLLEPFPQCEAVGKGSEPVDPCEIGERDAPADLPHRKMVTIAKAADAAAE
ncbi:MAG: hypothetical protein U9R73_06905 [Pseudomonadota bacterium]|jgi:hypothetical protein|nr:hypothetical protein [Pseudomonadota bacterium]